MSQKCDIEVFVLNDMSKKVTEGRISYGQYKLADIMLFLLITCVCEVVNIFAVRNWFSGMTFSISVMLLVTLIVLIRWNWLGVIFPIADGLLYCWMSGAAAWQYAVYPLGNAFAALVGLLFLVVPKEKITGSWLLVIAYALLAYVLTVFGRSVVSACFGKNFVSVLVQMFVAEALNLIFAVVGLLILRKINGMLTDQKKYLLKVTKERDTIKRAEEYHWDGYTELDDADLQRLMAMDEYDRSINFGGRSLRKLKENDGHELEDGADDETSELEKLEMFDIPEKPDVPENSDGADIEDK